MSSAVHLDRAKDQIACKVFIQCIKHTAAQSKLSVPLFFYLRNSISMEKGTGAQKAVPKSRHPILSDQVFPQESDPAPWSPAKKAGTHG